MKRILLLIKGLGRGGAEQVLVNAVRHGDRTRFAYEVAYLLPWKDALVGDLEALGVPVHCLDGMHGLGWIRRLRTLMKERAIDLVHMHSPYPAVGARLALHRKARLVYTEHNVWPRYHPLTYVGNLLTFPLNDHVFAVSDHVRESARYPRPLRFLRMPPIETLYHGPEAEEIDDSGPDGGVRHEFGIPEGIPVVGTVANLKAHKGLSYLLHAAVSVRRHVPGVRFILVGQGPLEQDLRREARALGLDGTVLFAGRREDVPRILHALDVFALPSIHEGLSIALIEAMAAGKPVVATRVGGVTEVVSDGTHGFVVPPADPRALSEAILTLLGDESLRTRFGEAGRRRASDFDISTAVKRVEQVYAELLTC